MLKTRLAIIGLLLAIVAGVGLLLGLILPQIFRSHTPPQIFNTATVIKQVQTLSQLVTVKYVLEKVIVVEDVKWYGESRVLMVAHGVVKAGIDLSQMKPEDIRISGEKITINMPMAAITDVYLDDTKTRIIERSTGILRDFDKDLEQNARRQAIEDLRRGARTGGIITDATDRARAQLTNLFLTLGFKEVEITQN